MPESFSQNRLIDWRAWLRTNSKTQRSAWLILFHKRSKTPSVGLVEATEEALCFGWIDSLCKKRDGESYYLTFSPRNPAKSNWSERNIERAERMIAQGKMTKHGRMLFEIGTGRFIGARE